MTHDDYTHPPPDSDPQPTAYALRGTLTLAEPWSEAEVRKGVDAFLAELGHALREQGCRLIGHIKGILETGDKGHLLFSVTTFDQKTRFKGGLSGKQEKMDLSLNVIVYGIDSGEIEQLVRQGLLAHLGESDP
jgi:hypothetical protein